MQVLVKIIGEIVYGETAQNVENQINEQLKGKKPSSFYLKINSPGGAVIEARAIRAIINNYKVPVITECYGQCSSAATELFLMGTVARIAHEGVRFMVHNVSGGAEGNYKDLASAAIDMQAVEQELIEAYMKRDKLKRNEKQWSQMLAKTTTFGAKELYEMGFATEFRKSFQNKSTNMTRTNLNKFFKSIGLKNLVSYKNLDVQLQDGTILDVQTEGDVIAVGNAVVIKDSEQVPPAGSHTLQDGTVIVTDESGIIVEIMPASANAPVNTPSNVEFENVLKNYDAAFKAQNTEIDNLKNLMANMAKNMEAMQKALEQGLGATFKGYQANADLGGAKVAGTGMDINAIKAMKEKNKTTK